MSRYNDLISPDVVGSSSFEEPSTPKFKSKVGLKFGFLTVVKLAGRSSDGKLEYYCQCCCGNFVKRRITHLTPKNIQQYKKQSCGCMYNTDRKIPLSTMIKRVEQNTNYEILACSELWDSVWTLNCKKHGSFKIRYASVKDGKYGCPSCSSFGFNPKKDSYFYINAISKDNEIVAFKYGITNQSIKDRMRQIVKNSEYSISNVFLVKDDGYFLKDLEKYIKLVVKSNYLTKKDIASGFTETIHPSQIVNILDILNQFYKET